MSLTYDSCMPIHHEDLDFNTNLTSQKKYNFTRQVYMYEKNSMLIIKRLTFGDGKM